MAFNAQAALDEAARRIQSVVNGLIDIFTGDENATVNNGVQELPSIAKVINDIKLGASGQLNMFTSYAGAYAALSTIPSNGIVEVFPDETNGNYRTRYQNQGGALVRVLTIDSDHLRSDLGTGAGAAAIGTTHSLTVQQLIDKLLSGNAIWCGTAAGTANAIVLTPPVALASYTDGQPLRFKAQFSSTGTVTAAASALAAKPLLLVDGSAAGSGDIVANEEYDLIYDAAVDSLRIIGASAFGGPSGASKIGELVSGNIQAAFGGVRKTIIPYATYAAASADVANIPSGARVVVAADENHDHLPAEYTQVSGSLSLLRADSALMRATLLAVQYVDPTNGNDAWAGASPGRAKATIAAAYAALNRHATNGGTLVLMQGLHTIGTAASSATGLALDWNASIIGAGKLVSFFDSDGTTLLGGAEVRYLGTGIAIETSGASTGVYSGGVLKDFCITNGGSGTIGLHLVNAQNDTRVDVHIGSTGNYLRNFSSSALVVDASPSGNTYPGFVDINGWFVGGSIPVKISAGITNVTFRGGIDGDDKTTIGFQLNSGGSSDSRFDLKLDNVKMELPNAVTAATVAALNVDSTAAQVTAGSHVYNLTFVTAAGESQLCGSSSNAVTNDGTHTSNTVTLPLLTNGSRNVFTSRKLYRSKAGTTTPFYLVATIADNTTTAYNDVTPDASLGAAFSSTAMQPIGWQFNADCHLFGQISANASAPTGTDAVQYTAVPANPSYPRLDLDINQYNFLNTFHAPNLTNGADTRGGNISANTSDRQRVMYSAQIVARHLCFGNRTTQAADIVLSAGWGSTASVAIRSGSQDGRVKFSVTAGGSGIAANPTCSYTTRDGPMSAFGGGPIVIPGRADTLATAGRWAVTATATNQTGSGYSTCTLTFVGTPVSGETYQCDAIMLG